MSKFNVTSSTLNNSFVFENENFVINGSYQNDAKTNELLSINGTVYQKTAQGAGQYVGNFNGRVVDGVIKYSLSDMTRQDTILVLNAIDEIEKYINGENQE